MKQPASKINYRSLFNNILDGLAYCRVIFNKDKHPIDFVYLEVSKNFEQLTGLKNVVGKKVTHVIPGIQESNDKLFEIYGRVALTGKPEKFEIFIQPLNRYFLISIYSPKKGYFIAVFQNTTDRKRMEKKLENAKIAAYNVFADLNDEQKKLKEIDRAKTEFVSLASHQLKTPPTAIKLLTERILSGKIGPLTPKQKEYMNDISATNQRMIDLVNTLLNVSRIELGEFAIELSEKNICEIIRNILNELKPTLAKKQLHLKQLYPDNGQIIMIDELLLTIAINNLLTNAINYTQNSGMIKVQVLAVNKNQTLGGKSLPENCVAVIVSDTGCGIPKKQQSKLFTKFFRADNAKKGYPNGTGLGLYITKSIIENSGGLIWFASQENKGTVFYITIPLTGMRGRAGGKKLIAS